MRGLGRFICLLLLVQLFAIPLVGLPAGAQESQDINPDWFQVKWEVQRTDSTGTLWMCDWSADGSMIACVYFDRHVNIYDPEDGSLIHEFDVPEAGGSRCDGQLGEQNQLPLRYVEFSPDNEHVAVCGDDKVARVYSTSQWELEWASPVQEAACLSVAWSPNSTWLVTGTGKEKVNGSGSKVNIARVYNIETDELVKTFNDPSLGPIVSSRFSPSGEKLAINSDNSFIYIFYTSNLSLERKLAGHTSGVLDCDWSQDELFIVSGSRDYTARVWDLVNGTHTKYDHDNCVRGARWDNNDRYFITSGIEKRARIYDPKRPDQAEKTFTEGEVHHSNIMASRWSPDGQSFVSALGKERWLVMYEQEEPPPPPWYDFILNKTCMGCCLLSVVSVIALVLIVVRPLLIKTRGRRG